MNILVINGSADLYGANRILFETLAILAKQHRIVLILPKSGEFVDYLAQSGLGISIEIVEELPVITRSMYSPGGVIKAIMSYRKFTRTLRQLKKKYAIDLAYINTLSCFFCIKICRDLALSPLVHIHEIIESPKFAAKLINFYGLRWANRAIAVSEAVRANLSQFILPADRLKITTILNGIPDLAESPDFMKKYDAVKVTLIARIKPEKGIWFFLEAIAAMGDTADHCIFHIVGSAPPNGEHYIEQLKKAIEDHPKKELIKYSSFMPDVSRLQQQSDILVVPSLMKDPFPTTILEAMRAGKPVIATNHGGSVQSVADNVTGYLIPPSDAITFAKAINKLVLDKSLRDKMGECGRERFLEMFTFEKFRERIQQYFEHYCQ